MSGGTRKEICTLLVFEAEDLTLRARKGVKISCAASEGEHLKVNGPGGGIQYIDIGIGTPFFLRLLS